MRQFIVIFVFLAFSTLSLAQRSRNWTIGANASSCMLNDDRLVLSKLAIEPGFQFNERLYVNLSIGYVENSNNALPEFSKFRGASTSLSITARLLKPKYRFSPLIGLEFGNIIYSNAKGATICRDFVLSDDYKNEIMGTFSNFRYLAKIKYMLDIQVLGVNFRFGPNYCVSAVRMYSVMPDDDYRDVLQGFGMEAGLMYTFKGKKVSE